MWQGQVFSRSGKSREYPNFVESTGYGTPGGLNGINCRHSWYPFFEGISGNAYTERDVQALADKKVNYQGREITQYEASQVQRGIERKIRKAKREASALDAAGLDNGPEMDQVRARQAEMRDFIRQTGLQRQRERERSGYTSNLSSRTNKIDFRSGEYQEIANLGDISKYYSVQDPGFQYVTPRPVIYNTHAASHLSDQQHRIRLDWLEENQTNIVRAITSPDFAEGSLRLRNDGFFSSTQIVELAGNSKGKREFLAVAISLSKNTTAGWHQITTIYPLKYRDLFYANGELKPKYVRTK